MDSLGESEKRSSKVLRCIRVIENRVIKLGQAFLAGSARSCSIIATTRLEQIMFPEHVFSMAN